MTDIAPASGVSERGKAYAEFRRMMVWVALVGVAMVVGSLAYLSRSGPLQLHMIIATVAGVFLSILLGCGLFAAAFFSSKSGHDQSVTDAVHHEDEG